MIKNILTTFILLSIFLLLGVQSLKAYVMSYDAHVMVSEEYSDNLYQDPDNEVDDFITVISPGVRSELQWQRTGVSASYDFGYSMYNTYSENDSMRHNASVGGWWDVSSNTQIRVLENYLQSEDTTALGGQNIGELQEDTYKTNTARVDLEHRFGERRQTSLGYGYTTFKNDGDETDNNQSHNVVGSLSYFFSPWIGMEAQFDYTKGLYDFQQDFDEWNGVLRLIRVVSRHLEWNVAYSHTIMTWEGDGAEQDYQVYNPSAGLHYTMENDSFMAANVGYFVQDVKRGNDEKGLTLDGNIGKTWAFRQGSFNVTGSSGYEDSQLGTDNLGFTIYYGVESGLIYQLHRDVTTAFNARFRNNDYINSNPDRNDKNISALWNLNWLIKPWLRSGLEYSWTNRNSNYDENDYTENKVQVFLTWVIAERTSPR